MKYNAYDVLWKDIFGTVHRLPLIRAWDDEQAKEVTLIEYKKITHKPEFVKFIIRKIDPLTSR